MQKRLLAVLALSILSVSVHARCGDCNADSNTNILDALQAAQDAASILIVADPVACDVDNSGAVNILDALRIAQFSAGLGVVLKCGDPVWLAHCGAFDTDNSLTVGPGISPPALSTPGSTNFYALEDIPPNALTIEIRLIFQAPTDYDLLVGGPFTAPGDTNPANYPLQDRFSNPATILIDSMSSPSIFDITSSGQPLAIAVHLFNNPGNSYTMTISCTQPIPPKIINVNLGSSVLETTSASSGTMPIDFLVPESTCWFVLNSFPANMEHLDVNVTNLSGDHDLYIGSTTTSAPDPYSLPNYPRSSATSMTVETYSLDSTLLAPYAGGPIVFAVTAVTPGNFTIDITGYSDLACGDFVTDTISSGTSPTRGRLSDAGATRLYKLDNIPFSATEIRIEMLGTSPTGDVDLYAGSAMWGDVDKGNYEFQLETPGTSDEVIVIDSMSVPDIFSFLGSPMAIAISGYDAGAVSLEVTCMTGGPPPGGVRNMTCGAMEMGMVTTPSGTQFPPLLAQPGTTDFYCLPVIPIGTSFVTFRVAGAAGSEYILLVGDPATMCGSTNPMQYTQQSVPTQNPEIEISVCTNPSLTQWAGGNVAFAVHWFSGTTPDYTIEVECQPTPMFCAPITSCGAIIQGGLAQDTGQFPTVVFSRGVDTDFWMLFPIPMGVGQITFNLGSPIDPDADYDLFVGGPFTMPCAGVSTAYMWSSQLSSPMSEVIVLTSIDLMGFGCQPIPIAVYYFDDAGARGGYALSITCN